MTKRTKKITGKAVKKLQTKTNKYQAIRLFVAVPSTDMVHADFAMSLAGLANHCTAEHIQIALNNTKGSDIARTRNAQVHQAKKLKATHLLFIDSDMVFKPWAAHRMLDQMLNLGEKIIGTTVPKRIFPYVQANKDLEGNRLKIAMDDDRNLVECSELGTGMVMIDMKVFEAVSFPWFESGYYDTDGKPDIEKPLGEDVCFFKKAKEAGFKPMCDIPLSQDTRHIGQIQFDYTSEDFFAEAVELRKQKAQAALEKHLKAKTQEKGEEVGEAEDYSAQAVS